MTFMQCYSLTSIILPDSLTTLELQAFISCVLLDSITLPTSLTTIGIRAFQDCTGLKSITIPKNVTTIEGAAFHNCTGLKSITIQARTPPAIESAVFNNVPVTIPVYIPCGTYEAYSTNLYWHWAWGIYTVPVEFSNFIDPARDTTFYSAAFKQGETYSDANFPNLISEGKYCKTLQSIDGCDSVVCLTLRYEGTNIAETQGIASSPKIYPNPATNQLTITNYELREATVDYSIYNIVGQKVMQGVLQGRDAINCVSTINVEPLAKGMYYLRVGEKTVKFIKE